MAKDPGGKVAGPSAPRTAQGPKPVQVVHRYLNFITGMVAVGLVIAFLPSAVTNSATGLGNGAGQITPPPAPGTPGVTVGGVQCRHGVRQVPWSKYAPLCLPAFHGKNGGATWRGVTPTTITITYRSASTGELSLLYSIIPKAVIGTNDQAVKTMQDYVSLFNKTFELYGRHVVLDPYVGVGDFINEDTGTGLAGAQADAITVAKSIKAFGDMSLVDASNIYDQDLAHQQVLAFSLYENSQQYYEKNAPYAYTPGPSCTKTEEAVAAIIGKSIAGLPAIYAGDPAMQHSAAKIGIVAQNTAQAVECDTELVQDLSGFGVTPVANVQYPFNMQEFITEAGNVAAQLQNAGASVVVCSMCDPVSPKFSLPAFDNIGYHPEIIDESLFSNGFTGVDPFGRIYAQDQMSHVIGLGFPTPRDRSAQEAYEAYKMTGAPMSDLLPSYPFAYSSLLELFDALQAAGPDLNPTTFEEGLQNTQSGQYGNAALKGDLEASEPGGEFGPWAFGPGTFDPTAGFGILYWDTSATSGMDGQAGAFEPCNGGTQYSLDGHDLPANTQLKCFGRS